ncbi:hypothetical protein [Streptomyces sp. Ncost-T10-10d]|uniref:hypothetical protein n=1 Tax=Streptomyces sp. Ncost-T10-10d TaxID=1839774 RepID=UPI00210C3BC9|nr:hypothetical protein [Streptomyces sp. Ncost-T10-10d]
MGTDADLAALVEEFAIRKTYRPTDDMAEPDEVPQGPSGTVMGDTAPPVHGAAELEAS